MKSEGIPRFGEYLINKGIVNEEAVLDALDYQRKNTLPMGKIALKERMLTMKQVLNVLGEQFDTTFRFGEMAIKLGFLKEEDIDVLLEKQIKLRKPLGEILVEQKKITRETLGNELTNYFNYLSNLKKAEG